MLVLMRDQETLYRRIRSRLREYGALRSAFHLALSTAVACRDSAHRSRQELDGVFDREDPWNYAGPREQARHAAELGMLESRLGGSFGDALEIGCAEGAFTQRLAQRCRSLAAADLSAVSLERAARRCAGQPNVRFEQWDVRAWPRAQGPFDLIVAIHVLEYVRSPLALARVRRRMIEALRPGGWLLVGNVYQDTVSERAWWGKYLLHGGNWINDFFAAHPALQVVAHSETDLGDCRSLDVLMQKAA
jgi:2-polyprenyl-3-methyl-5-hydroxy-6-metoxy-1,4-benzoquinol methylase